MKKYVLLMRLDHWIKQLFVFPGLIIAIVFAERRIETSTIIVRTLIGILSISLVASSNYIINEWLDAEFDKYHPIKKNRIAVKEELNSKLILPFYIFLFVVGALIGLSVSKSFFYTVICLWVTGIIYNVKPFRIKDIAFVDALFESLNNPIRFLLGWYIVANTSFPPLSILLSYWFIGAFLMTTKRFAEYRSFNNKEIAYKYRKSFKKYSEKNLLITTVLYGALSTVFLLIFSIKYRVELIVLIPLYISIICYYLRISFKENSIVQQPELIYKEKKLMFYLALIATVFIIAMKIDIPIFHNYG